MYQPCCLVPCCQGKLGELTKNSLQTLLYSSFCLLVHGVFSFPRRRKTEEERVGCRFMGAEPHKYTCHILPSNIQPRFWHVTHSAPLRLLREHPLHRRNPSTTTQGTRVALFGPRSSVLRKLSENSPCLASQSGRVPPAVWIGFPRGHSRNLCSA